NAAMRLVDRSACPASAPFIGVHGERPVGGAGMDAAALGAGAGGAEGREERQEVLVARVVAEGTGGAAAIIEEVVAGAAFDRRRQPSGEAADPVRRRGVGAAASESAEIVRGAARA